MKTFSAIDENIPCVAQLLNQGEVAIIPTDTVYGMAAHPLHLGALQRIAELKQRETSKPVALLAAAESDIIKFGALWSPVAAKLTAAYWPGALTLVLPCHNTFEGFRIPAHSFTRTLLQACGGVLRVTSANLSGQMPALSAATALEELGLKPDIVVDGGISPGGIPSTVVKLTPDNQITILREGAIPASTIITLAASAGASPSRSDQ